MLYSCPPFYLSLSKVLSMIVFFAVCVPKNGNSNIMKKTLLSIKWVMLEVERGFIGKVIRKKVGHGKTFLKKLFLKTGIL